MLRSSRIVASAAALCALSLAAAAFEGHPAMALVAAKIKAFRCSSASACLTSINDGAGNGIAATSTASSAIQGIALGLGSGVLGESDSASGGYGVAGRVSGGVATHALVADGGSNFGGGMYIEQSYPGFATMIEAFNAASGTVTFTADNAGNVAISGLVYTTGSCYNGCAKPLRHVVTYGSTETQPTIEDLGEARVTRGEAIVKLDRAYANTIDRAAGYIVLLSPEGDSSGLFVAKRTADAFVVRTVDGEPATLDFSYRIVAHPYAVRAPRLPAVKDLRDAGRLISVTRQPAIPKEIR